MVCNTLWENDVRNILLKFSVKNLIFIPVIFWYLYLLIPISSNFKPTPFYLLDCVTPTDFSDRQSEKIKIGVVKCIVMQHNFLMAGNICKLPFFDKPSDTNVQTLLYSYTNCKKKMNRWAKLSCFSFCFFFGETKVCLRQTFLANLSSNHFYYKSQFCRSADNVQ